MSAPHVLGFCSVSALDRPLVDAASMAASAGCDGIEVTARPPHLEPPGNLSAIAEDARAVRDAGIEVLAYGSYFGRERPLGAEAGRRAAEIANALGAPLLRVWAECAAHEDAKKTIRHLQIVCDAAADHGIAVVVERHQGSLADTPKRVEALLCEVDRPNFALNYQVLDLLPQAAVSGQPDDAARLVRHARYFHLKNYQLKPDGEGPLLPGGSLEKGVLDYRALLHAALDAGYDGPLTIEFLSFENRPLEERLASDVAWVRRVLAEWTPSKSP